VFSGCQTVSKKHALKQHVAFRVYVFCFFFSPFQAVDYQREGDKAAAASLSNKIAFWLALSCVAGIMWWSGVFIFNFAYRFQW
jgi:hypothetical protein